MNSLPPPIAAGRGGECHAAVAAAEEHYAAHRPSDQPHWSTFFQRANTTDLAYDNGSTLYFAGLHDPSTAPVAIGQLRTALTRPDAVSRRRRAMSTMKVATLELVHGDRDEGLALAAQALDTAQGVRSARLTEDLHRLRTATTHHTGPESTDLRHRLDTTLTA